MMVIIVVYVKYGQKNSKQNVVALVKRSYIPSKHIQLDRSSLPLADLHTGHQFMFNIIPLTLIQFCHQPGYFLDPGSFSLRKGSSDLRQPLPMVFSQFCLFLLNQILQCLQLLIRQTAPDILLSHKGTSLIGFLFGAEVPRSDLSSKSPSDQSGNHYLKYYLIQYHKSNVISESIIFHHNMSISKNKQHFRRKICDSNRLKWHSHRCICFKQEYPRPNTPGKSDRNSSCSPGDQHSRVLTPDGNLPDTSDIPTYQSSQGSMELVLTMISQQRSVKQWNL